MTLKDKMDRIRDFRPIDDIFFEVLASDREVCQEMLRTILEDDGIIVTDVIVQSSERNLYGRSVRLDALCMLGSGKKCNIEVQRSDNDNHLKRVRYNASVITAKETETGEKFEDIPELYVIYISEFDIFKQHKVIYHIDKVIRETGTVIDDGLHEIFVNTSVNDGTRISGLMNCMIQKDVDDESFPHLSERVRFIKSSEGGTQVMCSIMEKYINEAKAEGMEKGMEKGMAEGEAIGMEKGMAKGEAIGIEKGMAEGKAIGMEKGMAEGEAIGRIKTLIEFNYTEDKIIEDLKIKCLLSEETANRYLKQVKNGLNN